MNLNTSIIDRKLNNKIYATFQGYIEKYFQNTFLKFKISLTSYDPLQFLLLLQMFI